MAMLSSPRRPEIDHRTMKLIVGVIALSLASVTSFFAHTFAHLKIASISASYYADSLLGHVFIGLPRDVFVGCLFAISAFMLAYNGYSTAQMVLSKVAAIAGLCIALFPCNCDNHPQLIPHVHGISAAVMFGILAFFCYIFFRRSLDKRETHAKRRAVIYALCCLAILLSIFVLALDNFLHGMISSKLVRLTFYGERTCLVAFGVSWLTASHWIPVLASKTERDAAHSSQS